MMFDFCSRMYDSVAVEQSFEQLEVSSLRLELHVSSVVRSRTKLYAIGWNVERLCSRSSVRHTLVSRSVVELHTTSESIRLGLVRGNTDVRTYDLHRIFRVSDSDNIATGPGSAS